MSLLCIFIKLQILYMEMKSILFSKILIKKLIESTWRSFVLNSLSSSQVENSTSMHIVKLKYFLVRSTLFLIVVVYKLIVGT